MADSWAERRGRMVKCKTHGLHFDPEMTTGCTLCLRDEAKSRRSVSRPPQLVLILLCLLGMAAILLYLSGQNLASPLAELGLATEPPAVQKLDPEPYRGSILTLESALFRTPLDEPYDLLVVSDDVRVATEELSAAILGNEPIHGLDAADLIARLGQAIPADQVAVGDVDRARQQWARLRQQHFQAATWFSPPPANPREPATVPTSEYSDAAASLRAQLEDAAAEAEALDDPAGAPAGDDDHAFRWQVFARDWLGELEDLERRLSARPSADAASELLLAVQQLERALAQARALATSPHPPDTSDPRFDEAIGAALRAEQGFDELGV